MSAPYDIVWMTTHESGTPHAEALAAANPSLQAHTRYSIQGAGKYERTHLWRNCDRNIREWWRVNRETVAAPSFLFLEYDVYADVDLLTIIPALPTGAGIAAARIMSCVSDIRRFWPFADIPRLPRDMHAIACAAAPLGVVLISRGALDSILSPEYDAVFAADVFCELRLATVIRHAGYQCVAMDLLHVTATPTRPGGPGIYHPVK